MRAAVLGWTQIVPPDALNTTDDENAGGGCVSPLDSYASIHLNQSLGVNTSRTIAETRIGSHHRWSSEGTAPYTVATTRIILGQDRADDASTCRCLTNIRRLETLIR